MSSLTTKVQHVCAAVCLLCFFFCFSDFFVADQLLLHIGGLLSSTLETQVHVFSHSEPIAAVRRIYAASYCIIYVFVKIIWIIMHNVKGGTLE